jgi:hypothetical protein
MIEKANEDDDEDDTEFDVNSNDIVDVGDEGQSNVQHP